MTDKQPEALSIAKRLKDQQQPLSLALRHKAAAELRRLHEVNAELVEALQLLYICYADPSWISHGQQKEQIHATVRAAIAKATGEQQ